VSPVASRVPRRTGAPRFRRILHASDFSSASRRAFDAAVGLAKANGGTLTLVHALEPPIPWVEDAYVSRTAYDKVAASVRTSAAKRLDALVRRARLAGVRVTRRLMDGNPRDAIARAATRTHADLVVVGTHGRTGVRKLLLGSVAERVVATAPCPVLTVRSR